MNGIHAVRKVPWHKSNANKRWQWISDTLMNLSFCHRVIREDGLPETICNSVPVALSICHLLRVWGVSLPFNQLKLSAHEQIRGNGLGS